MLYKALHYYWGNHVMEINLNTESFCTCCCCHHLNRMSFLSARRPLPLTLLKILHGVMLIMKVLILPPCRVPFMQVPFSSQPDKLNLLQPDSPADFTACFASSTSRFSLAEGGSDKWHESRVTWATMTTYSISCLTYQKYVVERASEPVSLSL